MRCRNGLLVAFKSLFRHEWDVASCRSSGDIYYRGAFFNLHTERDEMVLNAALLGFVCACECVCRELVELSLR